MRTRWRVAVFGAVVMLASAFGLAQASSSDYYTNSSGHEVHRPEHAKKRPAGATAKCRDGEYSFSQHHRGTCSGHGGVAEWYR
ncbi:hypothetical protein GALL_395370 [mine drainage metagenome]|uniref:DUF3761 domain-containing protein n=1 Tax=mine drainage metagenome TaxID=410659 RepID=A0A1J5QMN3_9ZZZZ